MDFDAALRDELGPDERLLWAGRPRRGLLLRGDDVLLIPFSLLWGGFALFWEALAVGSHGPIVAQLWGIPFVFVGLYLIAGRFVVDALRRGGTYYGVTDERVLIVCDWFGHGVTSLSLRTLGGMSVGGKGAAGTITFGVPSSARPRYGAAWLGTAHPPAPSFESIPDARNVYEIIRRAQAAA